MTSEIKELTEELTEFQSQLNSNHVLKTVSQINDPLPEEENASFKPASQSIDLKLIELKRKFEEVKRKQEKQTSQIQEIRILQEELVERKKEFEKKKEKLSVSKQLLMSQMGNKKKKSNDLQTRIETDLLQMVKSLELGQEEAALRARIVDRLHSWSDGLGYAKFTEFLSYLDPGLKERIASNLKEEEKPTMLQDLGKSRTKKPVTKSNCAERDKKTNANASASVRQATVCEVPNSTNEEACEKTMQTSVKDDIKLPGDKNKAKDSEEGIPDKGYPTETNSKSRTTSVQQEIPKPDNNKEARRYEALETALNLRKKALPYTKRVLSKQWMKQFFTKVVNETNEAVLEIMEALELEEEAIDLRSSIVSRIMFWGSAANHSILIDVVLRKMPDTKDNVNFNGVTPLMLAAGANHTKTVKVLIERGVDVNNNFYLQGNALFLAVCKGNVRVVKMLLKAGIDINIQDVMGKSPLHFAADGNGDEIPKIHMLKILQLLLKAGANMELKEEDDATPLILAVFTHNVEAVRILLRAGANKNAQDALGRTALHFAVRDGQTNIFKMLLEAKVDLELKDSDGLTALHTAAITERADFIVELLHAGANPKVKSKIGLTAAQYARKCSIKTLLLSKL